MASKLDYRQLIRERDMSLRLSRGDVEAKTK